MHIDPYTITGSLAGGLTSARHRVCMRLRTPTAILALGATFSALEVVPLVLIGFEAYENLTLSRSRLWVSAYKWAILLATSPDMAGQPFKSTVVQATRSISVAVLSER